MTPYHQACHVQPGQTDTMFVFSLPFGSRVYAVMAPRDGTIIQVHIGTRIVYDPKAAPQFGAQYARWEPEKWRAEPGQDIQLTVRWEKDTIGERMLSMAVEEPSGESKDLQRSDG